MRFLDEIRMRLYRDSRLIVAYQLRYLSISMGRVKDDGVELATDASAKYTVKIESFMQNSEHATDTENPRDGRSH